MFGRDVTLLSGLRGIFLGLADSAAAHAIKAATPAGMPQRFVAALLFLCAALVTPALLPSYRTSLAFAQEQRALPGAEGDKIDAVLLLDTSGSMLLTDPQALRYEGAKLFINLLRPGDRIAVVAFDQSARVVSPFVAHDDETATKGLVEAVGALTASGQYTDLLAGVEAARDLIKQQKRPDATGIVLLLSDGKMDPDPKIGTAPFRSEQLLNAVLPDLKANSIKVNTLYFSEQADKQLLTEIALASEGASAFATSVDVIHQSFADLFLAVKKPQVVPLTGRGFSIDADVQEATFYLNRAADQELVLTSPSGTEIRSDSVDGSIKWFVGQRFDVVTVVGPEAGSWRVQGLASADGFATVLTNLKLVSDWPNSVTAGEPTLLQVRLNESDKPVVLPEVSSNTRYGVQIIPTDKVSEPILEEPLFDDGTHGDKISGDGIFSHRITLDEPGEYRMWLVAKGPTFDRRQQLPFRVKPPLIQIVVETEHDAKHSKPGAADTAHEGDKPEASTSDDQHSHEEPADAAHEHEGDTAGEHKDESGAAGETRILIRLSTEVLAFKNVRVSLTAVDEGRKRYLVPVEKGHDSTEYEVPSKAFPHDGVYELTAKLEAEGKKRGAIDVTSRGVKVNVSRGVDAPPVVALEVGEKEPEQPSPWPYAGGVFLLNGAATAFLFLKLKKQQSAGTIVLPTFVPATAANEFIAQLEGRLAQTEIDLNDPALQGGAAVARAEEAPSAGQQNGADDQSTSTEDSASGTDGAPETEKPEGAA
jgi:hypothetical protein